MAASDIILYNDIVNNRLVLNLNNAGQFTFATFFQGSKLNFKLYPVLPTNNAAAPFFSKADISNLLPFVYVGPRAGTTSLYASQETWSSVLDSGATTGYFSASLDLNTTQLNTALGTSDTLSTFLEIHWSESGVRRISYQGAITVVSSVYDIGGAQSLPTPAASYPTWQEARSVFVKWLNSDVSDRGKTVTLYSPDGTAIRTIGVNNDKSALDDLA